MTEYYITFRHGGKILEVGGGNNPLTDKEGNRLTYPNIDVIASPTVDIVHDLSKFPWPVEDKSYDGIFSRYFIEHLEWRKVPDFIKEIYRILKPGGKTIIFTSNTYEQAKKIVDEGINKDTVEMLFGSQEFPAYGGVHKMGFSPEYATKLFKEAGFNFVRTIPHPESSTDIIIEAYKINEVFEREYFEDGSIGYKEYRDFATHHSTVRKLEALKPSSVLDVGGGRGYIVRILENHGIKATCMDISKHCFQTRATDSFILHDACSTPWPSATPSPEYMTNEIEDKSFDLCFSINFLEHIPEDKLDDLIREMVRVSQRGVHGIHMTDMPFEELDREIDITHCINQPKQWWQEKFKKIAPDYNVIIEHPRFLEYDMPEKQPPVTLMPQPKDNLVKLNCGSFLDMFYWGWTNIDILNLHEFANGQSYKFIQRDVREGLPYEDNSVDIVMHNHLIEHLSREEGEKFLRECYRVLKPEGIIRVSTPDTKLITKQYLDGNIWEYKYINTGVESASDDAQAYYNLLLAGHKTIFDEQSLTKLLEKTGFKEIKRVSPFESRSEYIQGQTLSTHPSVSIVLEAEK